MGGNLFSQLATAAVGALTWRRLARILLGGAMLLVLVACQVAPAKSPAPLRSASVSLGDISMYYEEYGQGEPLVLLNGGLSSTAVWANQIPVFAQRYRLILLDSRGQGRTTDGDVPITYHLMAEDTVRLMDHLGIGAAYIVGWSDGANIGLDLAIHYPTRVRALVAFAANTTPDGLTDAAQGLSDEYRGLSPQPERLPVVVDKIRTMWLTEPNFTTEELASIRAPTLVIHGQKDELVRADHAASIAKAVSGAKFLLLPDAEHHAMTRRPQEWNKAVMAFLRDK